MGCRQLLATTASNRFTEVLVLEDLAASIGTIGDAYGNAVAGSTVELLKCEAIAANSPLTTGSIGHNNRRLHSTLGNIPPEECERGYTRNIGHITRRCL